MRIVRIKLAPTMRREMVPDTVCVRLSSAANGREKFGRFAVSS